MASFSYATKILSGLIILLACPLLFAQDAQPEFQKLYDKGREFHSKARYDSSTYYYSKALAATSIEKNPKEYIQIKSAYINGYLNLGQMNKADSLSSSLIQQILSVQPDSKSILADQYRVQGMVAEQIRNNPMEAGRLYRMSLDLRKEATPDSLDAISRIHQDISITKMMISQFDSAKHYLLSGLALFKEREREPSAITNINMHRQLSLVSYYQGNVQEAMDFLSKGEKSLDFDDPRHYRFIVDLYQLHGSLAKAAQRLDSALYYGNEALTYIEKMPSSKPGDLAILKFNVANTAILMGNYNLAQQLLEEALEIAETTTVREDRGVIPLIYLEMAEIARKKGLANLEAADYYKLALESFPEGSFAAEIKNRELAIRGIGDAYLALARSYHDINNKAQSKEYLKTASDYYQQALDIHASGKLPKDQGALSDIYVSQGIISQLNGDPIQAESYFLKGLELSRQATKIPFSLAGNAHLQLARLYKAQNNLAKAEHHFEKAEAMARQYQQGEIGTSTAIAQMGLATFHLEQQQYEPALAALQKAFNSNKMGITQEGKSFIYDTESQPINPMIASSALTQLGRILEGEAGETDQALLREAKTAFEQAIEATSRTSKGQSKLGVSLPALEYDRGAFIGHVRTSVKLYELSGNKEHLREAFRTIQLSKSSTLNKSVSQKDNKGFLNVPDSLIKRESELTARLGYLESELLKYEKAGDSARMASFRKDIFATKNDQASLEVFFRDNYEDYHQLIYGDQHLSPEVVQRQMSGKETLVEYFSGSDAYYAAVLSKNEFNIIKIPKTAILGEDILAFSNALISGDPETYHEKAHSLYRSLFEPLLPYVQGSIVTIVPDEALWNVSFDLLLQKPVAEAEAVNNYLINEYTISYAYSVTSLYQFKERSSTNKQVLAFSLGEEESGQTIELSAMRNTSLEDLPGSALEIRKVAQLLEGDYFYGTNARETIFKSNASEYAIIHLALHGIIDDFNHMNSRLYFNAKTDSVDDGSLYPFELYNMEFNTQLVVLSACNTGSGSINLGEGIMSLGRAFQYAGANSLLLTKWEISDQIAPEIIENFYTYLIDGKNKAEALRLAKLDFLKSTDNLRALPHYWGGFFILGSTDSITLNSGIDYTQVAIIITLFILSSLFAFRHSMRKRRNA